MNYEYYLQALEICSAWEIPESDFAQAVKNQARLMAGMNLEPSGFEDTVSPYHPLKF
jgi:hypothetical protein